MQTVSHGCFAALYPAAPLGRTWDVFIWTLPHYGFVCQTHTPLPLSSKIHFSSAKHARFICVTHRKTLGYTFALLSLLAHCLSPAHTHAHTHTPFGCNKTADQSHWLLTGTDTETCCCWKAAWEMFITHKACRFGQERNNGLIKWRPGAAVGEIHTHPRTHPHGLREKFEAVAPTERSNRLREVGAARKIKNFSAMAEFAEFGVWHGWQTDKSWHDDICKVNRGASAARREVKFCCRGMWRPHFHRSLLLLIGVSHVCLAYCITLTRRDSIFPTLLNLKPCFHSNSVLRLSKHSPPEWL